MSPNENSSSTVASNDYGQYSYQPSLAGAVVVSVIFTCISIFHIYQYLRYRSWFLYLLIAGMCMETAGYWTRVYSITHLDNLGYYALEYYLIMLAPSILAASCYMTFGRLIYWVTPPSHRGFRQLWLPIRFLAPTFVFLDIGSFCVQLVGILFIMGAMAGVDTSAQEYQSMTNQGIQILRFGLIIQMAVFGVFAILGTRFLLISHRWAHVSSVAGVGGWKTLAWAVNIACTLISIRALFRIFEFTLGNGENYITYHEWMMYCFDALPMILVIAGFNLIHPGKYLPQEFKGFFQRFRKLNTTQDDDKRGLKDTTSIDF